MINPIHRITGIVGANIQGIDDKFLISLPANKLIILLKMNKIETFVETPFISNSVNTTSFLLDLRSLYPGLIDSFLQELITFNSTTDPIIKLQSTGKIFIRLAGNRNFFSKISADDLIKYPNFLYIKNKSRYIDLIITIFLYVKSLNPLHKDYLENYQKFLSIFSLMLENYETRKLEDIKITEIFSKNQAALR